MFLCVYAIVNFLAAMQAVKYQNIIKYGINFNAICTKLRGITSNAMQSNLDFVFVLFFQNFCVQKAPLSC